MGILTVATANTAQSEGLDIFGADLGLANLMRDRSQLLDCNAPGSALAVLANQTNEVITVHSEHGNFEDKRNPYPRDPLVASREN